MSKIKLIPIYLIYISTFGLAAASKLLPALHGQVGAPDWFQKQFGETFLNAFSGALTLNFYFIAVLEATVTTGFIVSMLRREFQPDRGKSWLLGSLLLAQIAFAALGFGMRLTNDFHTAFELFAYFGVTLFVYRYVESIPGSRSYLTTPIGSEEKR